MRQLVLCLCVGCGPAPTLVSTCGVEVSGLVEGYQASEDRALTALAHVPELQGKDLCAAVSQTSVELVPGMTYTSHGALVHGSTQCLLPGLPGHVTIAAEAMLTRGSLTHELTHVILGCGREHDHPLWGERGLTAAQAESASLLL